MNTVSYNNFNENAKHYLDSMDGSDEEIIILKNKKPAFKISPLNSKKTVNILKNSIVFERDIISPSAEKWDSE